MTGSLIGLSYLTSLNYALFILLLGKCDPHIFTSTSIYTNLVVHGLRLGGSLQFIKTISQNLLCSLKLLQALMSFSSLLPLMSPHLSIMGFISTRLLLPLVDMDIYQSKSYFQILPLNLVPDTLDGDRSTKRHQLLLQRTDRFS